MQTGPKPKPGEIAAAQGNPGHRPIVTTPDAVPKLDSQAPIALSERGLRFWAELTRRLQPLGYVKATDAYVLARYCDYFDRWLSLRDKVNAAGESYETTSNHGKMQRINPDFNALMRMEERLTVIEDRIGLTPAARQSILARYDPTRDAGDQMPTSSGAPDEKDAQPGLLGMFAPRGPAN